MSIEGPEPASTNMHEQQYPIIAARRQGYDALLWQTPTLAVAAQGFLLAAALNKETLAILSLILLVAALLVGFAALQLFRSCAF
jgi:hypothetical protein